jgi:protein TonB
MRLPNIYQSQSMDDIVFENRNKNYGAYALRKQNDVHVLRGMLFVSFIVLAFSIYILSRKVAPDLIEDHTIVTLQVIERPDIVLPANKMEAIPTASSAAKATTSKFTEVKAVPDEKGVDKQLTARDALSGKQIGLHIDSSGISIDSNPIVTTGTGSEKKAPVSLTVDSGEPSVVADVMPSFDKLAAWLQKNIKYHRMAIDQGMEGKVYVQFIVNADGSIVDVIIIRGIGFGCDEAALLAVNKMPK